MPRIRKHHDKNYTVIGNMLIQNTALSWKARGILIYLLSMPEDWSFNLADLANRAPDGKSALRSGVKELEETGYIGIVKERGANGKFDGWTWHVYEEPRSENRISDKPTYENPTLQKKQPLTKETGNKGAPSPSEKQGPIPTDEYPYAEPGTVIENGVVVWRVDTDTECERTCPKCGYKYSVLSLTESRAACKECGMGVKAFMDGDRIARWLPPQKMRRDRQTRSIPYKGAVRQFCVLAKADAERLGISLFVQWGHELKRISDEAGASEVETIAALEGIIPRTEGWPKSPYQPSFQNELAAQLARAPTEEIIYTPEMVAIIQAGAANDGY